MEGFIQAVAVLNKKKALTHIGKVVSVDGTTCVVSRENLPNLTDVRLSAIIGDFEDKVLVYPSVGSEVVCLQIEGQKEETTIVKFTTIDKVEITIKGAVFIVEDGKFTIKNEQADLKEVLKKGFLQLKNAIITTPSGPGKFSTPDKNAFNNLKADVLKIFK